MTSVSSYAPARQHRARHQRRARYGRLRYSGNEMQFLTLQSTRLSTTKLAIFNFLYGNDWTTIRAASSTGSLVADPYPNRGS